MAAPQFTSGYHSILFADTIYDLDPSKSTHPSYRCTFDNWHMVPIKRPSIAPPPIRDNYQELGGADGSLDLTESLAGRTLFGMREDSIEFLILNGYKDWNELYTELLLYFHGKKKVMILEDDLAYFYVGRFTVSNYDSQKDNSHITINYKLEPYKKDVSLYLSNWLWDPFNFDEDIRGTSRTVSLRQGQSQTIEIEENSETYLHNIVANQDDFSTVVRMHYTDSSGNEVAKRIWSGNNYISNLIATPTGTSVTFICTKGSTNLTVYYKAGIL